MTYVFDEPSIGLHPHDVHRLNELLVQIRDKGNTVLVVEHEPDVIAVADHVVDMGPGAGLDGGTVVYEGDVAGLRASGTLTGDAPRPPPAAEDRRCARRRGEIRIEHATHHNLRDVSRGDPARRADRRDRRRGLGQELARSTATCRPSSRTRCSSTSASAAARGARTRRRTPACSTRSARRSRAANGVSAGAVQRELARAPARTATGLGVIYMDLAHLDGVASTCEACEGRRFTDAVLEHTLRGASIADVFDMPADAALEFFTEKPVRARLQAMRRRRPRLPHARPAAHHAVGRRAPAPEARQRARRHGEGVRARRADDRAAHARRRPARRAAGPDGRRRRDGDRHRARPRRHRPRGLDHRPRPGRRPRRRAASCSRARRRSSSSIRRR